MSSFEALQTGKSEAINADSPAESLQDQPLMFYVRTPRRRLAACDGPRTAGTDSGQ